MCLSQGLICTIGVHLGLGEVAFIEHVRGDLYKGCPHVRGGLYEGFHCEFISGLYRARQE